MTAPGIVPGWALSNVGHMRSSGAPLPPLPSPSTLRLKQSSYFQKCQKHSRWQMLAIHQAGRGPPGAGSAGASVGLVDADTPACVTFLGSAPRQCPSQQHTSQRLNGRPTGL